MSDTGEAGTQRLAANIKAARERAALPQREVAEQMRDRGQPWHQQTVAQVEAGTRTVGAVELNVLASILGTSMDALMRPADLEQAAADILRAARTVRESKRALYEATLRFDADAATLRRLLEKAREKGIAERLPNEMRAGMSALADRRQRSAAEDEAESGQSGHGPADDTA